MAATYVKVTPSPSTANRTGATISFTLDAGNNRVIVVFSLKFGNEVNSAVTFNSNALTHAITGGALTSSDVNVDVWYRAEGSSGSPTTANVVLTSTSGAWNPDVVFIVQVDNADQADPLGASAKDEDTVGTSTTVDVVLNAEQIGSLLIAGGAVFGGDTNPFNEATVNANQTERQDFETGTSATADLGYFLNTLTTAASGNHTLGSVSTVADQNAIGAIEIKAVSIDASSARSGKLTGYVDITNSRSGKVTGYIDTTNARAGKVAGYLEVSSARSGKLTGHIDASSARSGKIYGSCVFATDVSVRHTTSPAAVDGTETTNETTRAKDGIVDGGTENRFVRLSRTTDVENLVKATFNHKSALQVGDKIGLYVRASIPGGGGDAVLYPYDSSTTVAAGNKITISNANIPRGRWILWELTSGFISDLVDQGNDTFAVRMVCDNGGFLSYDINADELAAHMSVSGKRAGKLTGYADISNARAGKVSGYLEVSSARSGKLTGYLTATYIKSTVSAAASGSSLSISFTLEAGSNRAIAVYAVKRGNEIATGCTFNSNALTQIITGGALLAGDYNIDAWYRVEGTSASPTTANVALSSSTYPWVPYYVVIVQIDNVHQGDPVGASGKDEDATGSSSTADVAITVEAINSLVVIAGAGFGGDYFPWNEATVNSGQIERQDGQSGTDVTNDIGYFLNTRLTVAIGSQTFGSVGSATDENAVGAIEFLVAGENVTSARSGKLTGHVDVINARAGKVAGYLEVSSARSGKLTGYVDASNARSGKITASVDASSARSGKLTGHVDVSNARSGKLTGYVDSSNARSAKLTGHVDASSVRSGKLTGYVDIANARSGKIEGSSSFVDVSNARSGKVFGSCVFPTSVLIKETNTPTSTDFTESIRDETTKATNGIVDGTSTNRFVQLSDDIVGDYIVRAVFKSKNALAVGDKIGLYVRSIQGGGGDAKLYPYSSSNGVATGNVITIANANLVSGRWLFWTLTSGFIGDLTDQGNNTFAVRMVCTNTAGTNFSYDLDADELAAHMAVTDRRSGKTTGYIDTTSSRSGKLTGYVDTTSSRSGKITNSVDTSNARAAKLTGHIDANSARAGKLTGYVDAISSRSGKITNNVDTSSARAGKTTGHIDASSARSGKLTGYVDVSSARSGKLTGYQDSSSARSGKITNNVDTSSSRSGKLVGIIEVGSARSGKITNSVDVSNARGAKVAGVAVFPTNVSVRDCTLPTSIDGTETSNETVRATDSIVDGDNTNRFVRLSRAASNEEIVKATFDHRNALAVGDKIGLYVRNLQGASANATLYPYDTSNDVAVGNQIIILDADVVSGRWLFWELTAGFIGDLIDQGDDTFSVRMVVVDSSSGAFIHDINADELVAHMAVMSHRAGKLTGHTDATSQRSGSLTGHVDTTSARSGKITGHVDTSIARGAKLTGYVDTTNVRSAKVIGHIDTTSARSGKLTGITEVSSSRGAKISTEFLDRPMLFKVRTTLDLKLKEIINSSGITDIHFKGSGD